MTASLVLELLPVLETAVGAEAAAMVCLWAVAVALCDFVRLALEPVAASLVTNALDWEAWLDWVAWLDCVAWLETATTLALT